MAKGKKKFIIKVPQGSVYTMKTKSGKVIAKLEWDSNVSSRYSESFGRAQTFVDSECIRKMNPETPRLTGALIKTATLGTAIGSGEINQIAPYARRQYYEHQTKSRWFERMKNRHKDSILKGAEKIVHG